MDGAKSWQLAEIKRTCAPNAYGKHWAWVHWELRIPLCESFSSGPASASQSICSCSFLKVLSYYGRMNLLLPLIKKPGGGEEVPIIEFM